MSLPDDLNMPEWQRRRNAQQFGGAPALEPPLGPLSDDMPMDVWQQARGKQAAGAAIVGGEGADVLMGGAGADRVKAPPAPTFNVDREFLADREGRMSTMYVPIYDDGPKKGQVVGKSGATIGKGVDLGQQDLAYLKSLNLEPGLTARLSPYLGVKGPGAPSFVAEHPLQLSEAELDALNGAVQDRELRSLAAKYDAASQVGPFHKLPRDTQTAIASLYFQYGTAAPEKRTPNYWRQITMGDWEGKAAEARSGALEERHPIWKAPASWVGKTRPVGRRWQGSDAQISGYLP